MFFFLEKKKKAKTKDQKKTHLTALESTVTQKTGNSKSSSEKNRNIESTVGCLDVCFLALCLLVFFSVFFFCFFLACYFVIFLSINYDRF